MNRNLPSLGRVTLNERVKYLRLGNLFCTEGRDMETGELWYRAWSVDSQEDADVLARAYAAVGKRIGRSAIWISDEVRHIEEMPS